VADKAFAVAGGVDGRFEMQGMIFGALVVNASDGLFEGLNGRRFCSLRFG
jgi:hypothetical protein